MEIWKFQCGYTKREREEKKSSDVVLFCHIFLPVALCMCVCAMCVFTAMTETRLVSQAEEVSFSWHTFRM